MFFNAPAVIFVTSPNAFNGGLASSNMELMTDALGLVLSLVDLYK